MNLILILISLINIVLKPLIALCKGATIFLVISIALIVSASVFFRYVLNDSLTWSEEIAKYFMVWLVFVGAPVAMVEGRHIAIEIFPNLFKPKLRAFIFLCVNFLIVITMCFWTAKGLQYTIQGWSQVLMAIELPLGLVFASIPFGSAIMVLISLKVALSQILVMKDHEKYHEYRVKKTTEYGDAS